MAWITAPTRSINSNSPSSVSPTLLFVGEEVLSEEILGANFGGAICEWASAPPTIALVTETRGSYRCR